MIDTLLNNLDWLVGALKLGGSLNLVGCLTWTFVAIHREVYGLLLVVVPAMAINVRNWRKWSVSDKSAITSWVNRSV